MENGLVLEEESELKSHFSVALLKQVCIGEMQLPPHLFYEIRICDLIVMVTGFRDRERRKSSELFQMIRLHAATVINVHLSKQTPANRLWSNPWEPNEQQDETDTEKVRKMLDADDTKIKQLIQKRAENGQSDQKP